MGKDFFSYLPPEIILDIFLRLPTPSTMSCKCVCKPWLNLLEAPEFVKSHISKSVQSLAVFLEGEHPKPKPYRAFEFVDELNPRRRVRRWNVILNFNLPCKEPPYSSVDGLLFLCTRGMVYNGILTSEYVDWPRDLFICNPITREYIKLPSPPDSSKKPQVQMDTLGFGLSRISGQYKLVRIFHEWKLHESQLLIELGRSKCQIYNVGSGSWSSITSAGPFKYEGNAKGAFLNGNLHWLVRDIEGSSIWISCFDLETELFSTFSLPPCHHNREECLNLSTLKDCLCLCDNSADDEIVIWLMKEYGEEKSWTKEFVISKKYSDYDGRLIWPIKTFNNGDILMALEVYHMLLYFSRRTKTISHVDLLGSKSAFCVHAINYTPSFLPLKTYAMENVSSF